MLSANSFTIITYNLGHNILELYNGLIQTRLTTSKTKRDIYIANLVYKLPHELPNNLTLTILGNKQILGNLKFGWRHSPAPSLPPGNQTPAAAVKKHAKVDIKPPLPCPAPLDFLIPLQISCPGL